MTEISNERLAEMKAQWDGVSEEVHAVIEELEQRRLSPDKPAGGKDRFGNVNKKSCSDAATLLGGAFTWTDSAEGEAYWKRIYLRLLELASWQKKKAA